MVSTRMISSLLVFLLSQSLVMVSSHLVLPGEEDSLQNSGDAAASTLLQGLGNVRLNAGAEATATSTSSTPAPTTLTLKAQLKGFDFNLTSDLPMPKSTITPLETVPSMCADTKNECPAPAAMTAYSISFGDCGDAWTVCRCNNAELGIETVTQRLGRVPVGLRRYVGKVSIMGDAKGPHAYTLVNGDITIFGNSQMETFIHEAVHAYDFQTGSPVSGSDGWLEALGSDTCVPDDYSLTNRIEAFAQVAVLKIYALAHFNKLPPGVGLGCMAHQFEFFDSLALFDPDTLFANTCDFEDQSDSPFPLNLGAKKKAAPTELDENWVFPLPQTTSTPTGATTSVPTPTPSGFNKQLRPMSVIKNSGAVPTGAKAKVLPQEKHEDNAAMSVQSSAIVFYPLLALVGAFMTVL